MILQTKQCPLCTAVGELQDVTNDASAYTSVYCNACQVSYGFPLSIYDERLIKRLFSVTVTPINKPCEENKYN